MHKLNVSEFLRCYQGEKGMWKKQAFQDIRMHEELLQPVLGHR